MAEEGKVARIPEPDKDAHQRAVQKIQDEIETKQNRMVSHRSGVQEGTVSPASSWARAGGRAGDAVAPGGES